MDRLLAWFKSKNITSHTVAAILGSLAVAVTTRQDVRDALIALLKGHPVIVSDVFLIAGIVAKYSHSSSPAGAVAQAKAVLSEPDAPSAKAVDAATPPK